MDIHEAIYPKHQDYKIPDIMMIPIQFLSIYFLALLLVTQIPEKLSFSCYKAAFLPQRLQGKEFP